MNIKTLIFLAILFATSTTFAEGSVPLVLPPKRLPQSAEAPAKVQHHRAHKNRSAHHAHRSRRGSGTRHVASTRVIVLTENDFANSKPAPIPQNMERALKDRVEVSNRVDNRFFEIQ